MTYTTDNATSMDGIQNRLERFIEKIKGHIELNRTPELHGLIQQDGTDQIVIGLDVANDAVSLLSDCLLGFSSFELDAAQGGFAMEETVIMSERIRILCDSQANLIRLLKGIGKPEHAKAIHEAEALLGIKGAQRYN